jgi:hypothetical protein
MQFASSCHCIIYENFVILDNVNVSLVHLIVISKIYVENAFNFFINEMHTSDGQDSVHVTRKLLGIGPLIRTSDRVARH